MDGSENSQRCLEAVMATIAEIAQWSADAAVMRLPPDRDDLLPVLERVERAGREIATLASAAMILVREDAAAAQIALD